MIFSTTPLVLRTPLPYPGGLVFRETPLLKAVVYRAASSEFGHFTVDTAADSIILPETVAPKLNIDLTINPGGTVTVIGGARVPVRYAEVEIEIRGSGFVCRWRAMAGFAPTNKWPFGHFGGLEHFFFSLDVANEEFMLVPRDTLPRV